VHPLVSLPSLWDLGGLAAYVVQNPYLFISSSTVMTTGLLLATLTLGAFGGLARFAPKRLRTQADAAAGALHWLAPKLALVLLYFGVGCMALATEILLRFHSSIPVETELQFRSGLGHLAEAAIGIAVLSPFLRRVSAREWVAANLWALGYWTFHVLLLTPPWFYFQGQGEAVLAVTKATLAAGLGVTLFLWHLVSGEREAA
jgi:hypothetical protein